MMEVIQMGVETRTGGVQLKMHHTAIADDEYLVLISRCMSVSPLRFPACWQVPLLKRLATAMRHASTRFLICRMMQRAAHPPL